MHNIGLMRFKTADIESFTTNSGIRVRRIINRPMRFLLKIATPGKIIIEQYPQLEKKKPYIFVSTHSFVDEITTVLSTIDRSAYTLIGTTDQLEHNPKIYANWITGIIYVNREDEKSRKESLPKMERIINSGSSILMFPEGGWNNSENLLVQKLFPGPYKLSKLTNVGVVPISTFNEFNSPKIYIRVGEPMDLFRFEKKEALLQLRNTLATMQYDQIDKYSTPIKRAQLGVEPRLNYMEERRQQYLKTKWTRDVWDEELTVYIDRNCPTPECVRESVDNVSITADNAKIFGPILVKRMEDKKYNFNSYMHENWDK